MAATENGHIHPSNVQNGVRNGLATSSATQQPTLGGSRGDLNAGPGVSHSTSSSSKAAVNPQSSVKKEAIQDPVLNEQAPEASSSSTINPITPATQVPVSQILSALIPASSAASAAKSKSVDEEVAYLLSRKRLRTQEDLDCQQATRSR